MKLSPRIKKQFEEWGRSGGNKTKELGSEHFRELQKESVKARKKNDLTKSKTKI